MTWLVAVECETERTGSVPSLLHLFISPAAEARLAAARTRLLEVAPGQTAVIVAATRAAADELAFALAHERGGSFGVTRTGFAELATRLAMPALAREGLSPTGGFGAEAIAARAAFDAVATGRLTYFAPVGHLPGFPRALSRTLNDLRLGGVTAADLAAIDHVGGDLAELLTRVGDESRKAGTVDRAHVLATAVDVLERDPTLVRDAIVVLIDVAVATEAERRFVGALARASRSVLATVPEGDERTLESLRTLAFAEGGADPRPPKRARPAGASVTVPGRPSAPAAEPDALSRLQRHVFSREGVPEGALDESVVMFSAPGEGRECVEIARRIQEEAARGVLFDRMAVMLRAPHTYLGLLEHALQRAGIPSWFDRGTRRPDPAGRAFLALLACADDDLSARRFAEYLSLGQVPPGGEPVADAWSAPTDEISGAVIAPADQPEDPDPEDQARAASGERERGGVVAGTLRAPWRWEELLVESAVIGQLDRWNRRLRGLREEYKLRLDELASDEPESPRIPAIRRDLEQLDHLRSFALPIVHEMIAVAARYDCRLGNRMAMGRVAGGAQRPRAARAAPTGAGRPRLAGAWSPCRRRTGLAARGARGAHASSADVDARSASPPARTGVRRDPGGRARAIVRCRLRPRPRRTRVSATAARGRAAPRRAPRPAPCAAAETEAPRRRRAAPTPPRHRRRDAGACTCPGRGSSCRNRGSACHPFTFSILPVPSKDAFPRMPRYVIARSRRVPPRLAWPAPEHAHRAIDEFEHDLSMLYQLLREPDRARAKGRARYLYELSPHLQRSLTGRWAKWQKRWHQADGLIRATPTTAPALGRQRLGARPFSLSALQRFAECPYQFSPVGGLPTRAARGTRPPAATRPA